MHFRGLAKTTLPSKLLLSSIFSPILGAVMEFQAVILAAGHGSRMTDLTAKTPKALLPIANKPMIWYPIQLLERAGFQEATIVTHKSTQSLFQNALEEICNVKISLNYVEIPKDEDWGTADTLRHMHDKVKRDLLLISCDLITDIPLHLIADIHRTYDSTMTMLLAPLTDYSESSVPGGKANKKIEKDYIGLDEKASRVLFMGSEADFEESVTIRKSLLKKHPFIDVRTQLLDGHLYIMKKWIVDYLCENPNISTIKGEFIPHLISKQFAQKAKSKVGAIDIYKYAEEDEYTKLAREYSSWNDHSGDLDDCFHGDKIRCYAYIMDGGYCIRANTLLTYCEANRQIPRQFSGITSDSESDRVHPAAAIPKKSTVGADSMVGEYTTLGEKVGIKRSVIGSHCTIAEKVKIHNSVIMDHVIIDEGASITGCVICPNAHINEKCELKDCVIGESEDIKELSKATNEILVSRDRMMEF